MKKGANLELLSFDNPGKLELMIVDDDKIVSNIQAKVLEKHFSTIRPSFHGNGLEALNFIKQYPDQETSFAVFLDLNMPVMNGWQFLEKCKVLKATSRIYVFVVTSLVNTNDLYRALDYKNVIGFSIKPLTHDSLISLFEFPAVKNLFLQMEYEALENDSW